MSDEGASVLWATEGYRIITHGHRRTLQFLAYNEDWGDDGLCHGWSHDWEDVDTDEMEYREYKKDDVIEALLNDLMSARSIPGPTNQEDA